MRIATVLAVALLGATCLADSQHARATIQYYQLNIPRQPLDTALKDLAQQTGLQIGRFSGRVDGSAMVGPVKGDQTPGEALKTLLSGTGLDYKIVSDTTIAVYNPKDISASALAEKQQQESKEEPQSKSFWDRFRLAQADPSSNSGLSPQSSALSTGSGQSQVPTGPEVKKQQQQQTTIEEIVVTAQKRSEKLSNVPSSVSAVSGDRLESLHVNSLTDLADYVPGLSISGGSAPGYRTIAIRGLSTGYENLSTGPLVATYVDDIPVGATLATAEGAQYGLDLDPYDIERIEVLKGPQGTLYGANAMGGLIKYVLRKPDFNQFAGNIGADSSYIDGSDKPSWSVHGALNVPLVTDKLALRLSGFYKNSAGYIDNLTLGTRDVNHSTENGSRASVLWHPTDRLTVNATILTQDIDSASLSQVTVNGATLQPLDSSFTERRHFAEPYKQQSRIYSAGINWDLDFATLSASTGWSQIHTQELQDYTTGFGLYTPGHPDALAPFTAWLRVSKFVEELRLTSPENQRVQWMLGGYYTREKAYRRQYVPTLTPAYVPLPVADYIIDDTVESIYRELAGFANITFKLSDRLDLGGGARYTAYSEQSCIPSSSGVFGDGATLGCSSLPSTGVAVWMASARFHLNENKMLYGRVATGYRPGSGCPTCGNPALEIPGEVKPDKTTNYEVGFKGSFLDQRLQLGMAVFHINWEDIQLNQRTSKGLIVPGNGGTAVSNGFELTTALSVTRDLRLNGTLAYTDAHLTQDAPGAGGNSGDQLPVSPRWTGSLAADYSRPLSDRTSILFTAAYRYRDALVSQFAHSNAPLPIGPQSLVDLSAGLAMNSVTIRLYATNVFNKYSYTGLFYLENPLRPEYVPLQPRTIGVSVDYEFK